MNKITVIHHSADFDGIFCREIAKRFLPDATLIGWDYKDEKLWFPAEGLVYVLDLSPDCFHLTHDNLMMRKDGGFDGNGNRLIWIDHHKSSIEKFPNYYTGYRIDGVAACRLAYQWFIGAVNIPGLEAYKQREVDEPLAVTLAGEYDIWDKQDSRADTFQFGLRSRALADEDWKLLISDDTLLVYSLLKDGELLQKYQQSTDKGNMYRSYLLEFQGLKFLTLNTSRCNSLTFDSKDIPETGHDALLAYYFDGTKWNISMYHAEHRKDLDLSMIAVNHGGGGHRGACGFNTKILPF